MVWKRAEENSEAGVSPAATPTPTASRPASSVARRERAVIGESITIQGDLSGEEDLTVLGRVQGTVDVKSNSVTIGESGHVKADVYGKTIIVEGRVEGNLFGGEQIVLRATGDVRGNLTAPRVSLEDGAQFKGAIDMEPKRSSSGGAGGSRSESSAPSSPSGSSAPSSSGAPAREKAAAKAGG